MFASPIHLWTLPGHQPNHSFSNTLHASLVPCLCSHHSFYQDAFPTQYSLVKACIPPLSWSFPWPSPLWTWSDLIFPWTPIAQSGTPFTRLLNILYSLRQSFVSHCVTLSKLLQIEPQSPVCTDIISNGSSNTAIQWPWFFGVRGDKTLKSPKWGLQLLRACAQLPGLKVSFSDITS